MLCGAILLYNRNNTADAKYWPYIISMYLCGTLKCASSDKSFKKYPKAFKIDMGTIK